MRRTLRPVRDILPDVQRWRADGVSVAIATVVSTWGSAPRVAGSKMAVASGGRISGSVSGGCVEGAVVEIAGRVLQGGESELAHFGISDETAWSVGLACGGSIDVLIEPLDAAVFDAVERAVSDGRAAAVATHLGSKLPRRLFVAEGEGASGGLGDRAADDAALAAAREGFADGKSRRLSVGTGAPLDVFVDVATPAPTLIIVGGVHIAVALDAIARTLGYRTVVVDPRSSFGSAERFPHVDQLIQEWPDQALKSMKLSASTAVAVLTHDPKLDDPALTVALPSTAFYVGALGSQRTQEKRKARLAAAGLTPAHLGRLHAPIGLDLGGRSPEEIALSVMAHIVAVRNGRSPVGPKKQGRDL